MKKAAAMLLALLMPLLSSCSDINIYSEFREPDNLIVIRTVGVDYKDGLVTVTAETGTGINGESTVIFSKSEKTLAEAINAIRNGYIKDEAYFSHVKQILIGEEAGRHILAELLDYASRNVNMRMAADIYVVKGAEAGEVIVEAAGNSVSASEMLEAVEEQSGYMNIGFVTSCEDMIEQLKEQHFGIALAIEKSPVIEITDEKESASLAPCGYGLFVGGKLADFTNPRDTAGIGIAANTVKNGTVTVNTENGEAVLQVTDIKAEYSADYKEGKITDVYIDINVKVNVVQAVGNYRFSDTDIQKEIEKAAASQIEYSVMKAISSSQSLGMDYCGIGKVLSMESPYEFGAMEYSWEELFPYVSFGAKARVQLERTFDIEDTFDLDGGKNGS